MTRTLVLLSSLALVLAACKGESPPAAEQSVAEPETVIPVDQATAADRAEPASSPAAPEAVEQPPTAVAEPTLPEAAPHDTPSDATSESVNVLLGSGEPETIEIVAVHELGKRRIVLYRVDVAEQWKASRPAGDPLLERLAEGFEQCEDEDDAPIPLQMCCDKFAREAGVPSEVAVHLAVGASRAWELAHLEFDRAGKGRVLARKRLHDYGFPIETELVETKLKVYDMDGDKRSEVLVVFAVAPDTDELYEQAEAGLAFVLDTADLHIQYATTRNYWYEVSDVSATTHQIDTAFTVRDQNADGHGDLVVREHGVREHSPGEDDGERPSKEQADRSTVCLYMLADDAWSCPEWLGTEMIDGSKLVERTTVPVVLEPQAPASH